MFGRKCRPHSVEMKIEITIEVDTASFFATIAEIITVAFFWGNRFEELTGAVCFRQFPAPLVVQIFYSERQTSGSG